MFDVIQRGKSTCPIIVYITVSPWIPLNLSPTRRKVQTVYFIVKYFLDILHVIIIPYLIPYHCLYTLSRSKIPSWNSPLFFLSFFCSFSFSFFFLIHAGQKAGINRAEGRKSFLAPSPLQERTQCAAQGLILAGLELKILLSQSPWCWYRM